jgi:hypothetical protein
MDKTTKGLHHVVLEEREDPFENLTQSDEEDAAVHIIDMDEDEEEIKLN